MKSPKKTVSRRKFIEKSSLLPTVPVIAAGLPASSLANVQDINTLLRLGSIRVRRTRDPDVTAGPHGHSRKTRRRVERGRSLIESHWSSP